MTALHNFLYPRRRYQGSVKPENLVFNANLQEFSQRVSYICGLQTGDKLTPNEAVQQSEIAFGINSNKVINNSKNR